MYFKIAWLSKSVKVPYLIEGRVWLGFILVYWSDLFSDFKMSITFSLHSILANRNNDLTALDGDESGWKYKVICSYLSYLVNID